jgi:hypothetical protein
VYNEPLSQNSRVDTVPHDLQTTGRKLLPILAFDGQSPAKIGLVGLVATRWERRIRWIHAYKLHNHLNLEYTINKAKIADFLTKGAAYDKVGVSYAKNRAPKREK